MEMMERRGSPTFRSLTGGPRAWWDPCVSVSMAGWATLGDPRPRREEVVLQWRRSEEGEARRWFWNGDDGEERRWFCNGEEGEERAAAI